MTEQSQPARTKSSFVKENSTMAGRLDSWKETANAADYPARST
jgi:hypothetical protein